MSQPRSDPPTHDFNHFLHHLRTEELSELAPGARTVLSGGCAGDWYFDWFATSYPTSVERHIGVEAYTQAPERLPAGVEWLSRTLGDLTPVGDGSVDLVFAGQVLEHMWADEVAGFLLESHRTLREGGILCIDSPNRVVTLGNGWWQPEHTVEFTVAEVRTMLTLAGFTDIAISGIWLCRDPQTGAFLGVDIDAGEELGWPWHRRVAEARTRPEESFVWWATARNGGEPASADELADVVSGIFLRARPQYLARLRSNVGSVDDGAVSVGAGTEGFMLFGPYIAVPPGPMCATFHLRRPAGDAARPEDEIVRLEVSTGEGVLAMASITASMVPPSDTFTAVDVPFEFDRTAFGVEFRAYATGRAALSAITRVDLRTDPSLGFDADHGASTEVLALRARLATLESSRSWRLTEPLRRVAAHADRIRRGLRRR